MFDSIKGIFRRRALKKNASPVQTAITPVSSVKTAVTFIDVEDTSFDACKEAILSFYRENGIKGEIFFFDFRKIGSGERLITSITNTVLERDVNWYGKPSEEKMKLLENLNPELFISLIKGTDFPIEYMATCSRARFKIGRCQIPGRIFDMVVADAPGRETSQLEVFKGVKKYLRNIGA